MHLNISVSTLVSVCILLSSCGGMAGRSVPEANESQVYNPQSPQQVDCSAGLCETLMVVGDPYATSLGTFKGYSDPHLIADPNDPNQVWLSYSWLEVDSLTNLFGNEVMVAIVSNHLARSEDGGKTFDFVSEMWPSIPVKDPEGSGAEGLNDSETASLAWIKNAQGEATWFGAHLRYFLRPVQGYSPKFSTSYTIRVTAASTPQELNDSPEAVLGVSSTASVYNMDVALDVLVSKSLTDCAMANNPSLFANDSKLYLVFECLAFKGSKLQNDKTTIQLIASEPSGPPDTWTWWYVGEIANGDTYNELGVDILQQPDISLGRNGELLFTVTPSTNNPGGIERLHQGMLVLELEQLNPPILVRDYKDNLLIHAQMTTEGLGGCTFSSASVTGVLCHSVQTDTEPRYLYKTGAMLFIDK